MLFPILSLLAESKDDSNTPASTQSMELKYSILNQNLEINNPKRESVLLKIYNDDGLIVHRVKSNEPLLVYNFQDAAVGRYFFYISTASNQVYGSYRHKIGKDHFAAN